MARLSDVFESRIELFVGIDVDLVLPKFLQDRVGQFVHVHEQPNETDK
jgi:hypothetical protein